MRGWSQGLACVLAGVLGASARADDRMGYASAPAVSLDRPRPLAPAPEAVPGPAFTLGRPQPLCAGAMPAPDMPARVDPQVTVASFSGPDLSSVPAVVPGQVQGLQPPPPPPGQPLASAGPPPWAGAYNGYPAPECGACAPAGDINGCFVDAGGCCASPPGCGCCEGCCQGFFGPGGCCQEHPCTFWASAEYLRWWFKGAPVPTPFLESAPATTLPDGAVVAGTPIVPILGGGTADTGTNSGARFTAGAWLDGDDTLGVEGSFFFFPGKNTNQSAGISNTQLLSPFLLIPLIQPGITAPQGLFIAENTLVGSSAANTLRIRDTLFGSEANGILNLARDPSYSLDLISGFRYLQFEESLAAVAAFNSPGLFAIPPAALPLAVAPFPTNTLAAVGFADQNRFYGGNLGARGEYRFGNFFVSATGKVALGVMEENLNRAALVAVPGFSDVGVQHFSNISRFAVVPEANLNVGYQFADWARAYVGYNFLYASDVVRPGEQINPAGLLAPPVQRHTDFWAQGLDFGLEFRF